MKMTDNNTTVKARHLEPSDMLCATDHCCVNDNGIYGSELRRRLRDRRAVDFFILESQSSLSIVKDTARNTSLSGNEDAQVNVNLR